ncbi:hypothetical protein Achl_4272 (plasmid) [Pseudarthrobacter chlorophenolicus A6]|uniref:Transglutaminase-like domain-containing protein n=1 Tax=Pseudarthrobacter chlorophenolicus (strain ATCC 700700 / DSM 12829 / CIP 107037 / JCM 12360 / KCTC 9906 / NCIMB 13794 / A6) TaxID=452863 RepID=B8HIH6_PSECP|nr:hypothetical protein [Pseudarthrobacter chlorophenolicus]ACL42223.1 hypothetical protein Achl_4272 [Pseudarthrobacter chlorophenolicus A6]SDQ15107.1 hypothetical protein SAMN04489738_0330 [Pseudarthrobacter chlorophenolicus]
MTAPDLSGQLIDLFRSYIAADPRLGIWLRYPYISDDDDSYTDGWACESVSAEFAAFARESGWIAVVLRASDPVEPRADYHSWVRLSRDGALIDVDWTARQFHNLFAPNGNDPNVLTLPWPLAWDPAVTGPTTHLIVGEFATVEEETQ